MIDPTSRSHVGVSVAGPRPLAGMSAQQREAHVRLASLPKLVHLQVRKSAEEIALERGRRSAQTKRVSGRFAKGSPIVLEGSLPKGAKR